MNRRVAFLAFHAHANLPDWFNCPAKVWMANGYTVDVIVPQSDMHAKFGFQGINGKIFYAADIRKRFRTQITRYFWEALKICRKGDYGCLMGFGQKGLIVAGGIARILGIPLIFQSLELEPAKTTSQRILKYLEKAMNKRALMSIIQDGKRAGLLAREQGIAEESIYIVPNSTLGPSDASKSNYLLDKLGIEDDKRIVLYSGSLAAETMSLEVLQSVETWPEKLVLVMQGWTSNAYKSKLYEQAEKLPGRVFLSFEPVPFEQLHLVFRSADIGLAMYDYQSIEPNIIYVGQAAGKIFNYFKYGIPCVATALPGLNEMVGNTRSGICINNLDELAEALSEVLANYDRFRSNALNNFDKYEFSKHYQKIIDIAEDKLQLQ